MQIFPDVTTHVSDIPVEVKATEYMTENALSVTNSYVDKITVQVTGKRYEVGNLTASDFTASADLSAITAPGEYKVKAVSYTHLDVYKRQEHSAATRTSVFSSQRILRTTTTTKLQ